MNFENDLLCFELPPGWDADEDDDGNILCFDADDLAVWLQVELLGVEKSGDELAASSFLAECYSEDISDGYARLEDLDSHTALVTRAMAVDHEDTPYLISYFHLAHNQSKADIQMVQFGLAFPENRGNTDVVEALREFVDKMVRSVVLYPWVNDDTA